MTVIIGVDPHKSTHTVAIDRDERPLARLRLVADRCQTQRLLAWAEPLGTQRTWAVESAGGLGKLLAQKLAAARLPRHPFAEWHGAFRPRPGGLKQLADFAAVCGSPADHGLAPGRVRAGSRRRPGLREATDLAVA